MIKVPFVGRLQSVHFSKFFVSGTVIVRDVDYVKDHFFPLHVVCHGGKAVNGCILRAPVLGAVLYFREILCRKCSTVVFWCVIQPQPCAWEPGQ